MVVVVGCGEVGLVDAGFDVVEEGEDSGDTVLPPAIVGGGGTFGRVGVILD